MKAISLFLLVCAVALAQESTDRITVPFSDASRPQTVTGHLVNGCFTVEGTDAKEVTVEGGAELRHSAPRADGLRRISPGIGVTVEESNNTIRISGPDSRSLTVRVPRSVTLKMECTNGGDLKVSNVAGDVELNNVNGSIRVAGVAGSVLAHSLNGKLTIALDRVAPDKPMSFSTLNGDIDVTLPADTRATLKLKSDNGEIYTDFEVKLQPNSTPAQVEDKRSSGGKYKVKMDKATIGTINGGGPEMSFKTLNGNIFVRQKK